MRPARFIAVPAALLMLLLPQQLAAGSVQPDLMIRRSSQAGFTGDNVYDSAGQSQLVRAKVKAGRSATFVFRAQNDGGGLTAITLAGARGPASSSPPRETIAFSVIA